MKLWKFLKQLAGEMGKDKVGQLSAAFSYAAIFAIVPALLVAVVIVGFFFGEKAVQGQLFSQISDVVGSSSAQTIQSAVANIHSSQHGNLALALGLLGALIGAAGLAHQMQYSFDVIFSVVRTSGLMQTVYIKLKNVFILILGILVITASVLAASAITWLGSQAQSSLDMPVFTLQLLNFGVSLALIIWIIYLLYAVLPDAKLPRKVMLSAAIIIGILFSIGKYALSIVIARNKVASAYGAAASLVTLLLWFYYTGQIFFIGAEGIKIYLANRGYEYPTKRYTMRKRSLNFYMKNDLPGRMMKSFANGFTKKARSRK